MYRLSSCFCLYFFMKDSVHSVLFLPILNFTQLSTQTHTTQNSLRGTPEQWRYMSFSNSAGPWVLLRKTQLCFRFDCVIQPSTSGVYKVLRGRLLGGGGEEKRWEEGRWEDSLDSVREKDRTPHMGERKHIRCFKEKIFSKQSA